MANIRFLLKAYADKRKRRMLPRTKKSGFMGARNMEGNHASFRKAYKAAKLDQEPRFSGIPSKPTPPPQLLAPNDPTPRLDPPTVPPPPIPLARPDMPTYVQPQPPTPQIQPEVANQRQFFPPVPPVGEPNIRSYNQPKQPFTLENVAAWYRNQSTQPKLAGGFGGKSGSGITPRKSHSIFGGQ